MEKERKEIKGRNEEWKNSYKEDRKEEKMHIGKKRN